MHTAAQGFSAKTSSTDGRTHAYWRATKIGHDVLSDAAEQHPKHAGSSTANDYPCKASSSAGLIALKFLQAMYKFN
jgi:hypothetical protein